MDELSREARKEELLVLARRSRSKWVLDALPQSYLSNQQIKGVNNKINKQTINQSKSPVIVCIQELLDLLNELVDDNIRYDIDTTYLTDDEIDISDIASTNNKNNNIDSYAIFLNILCNHKAYDIINSIQKFILKLELTIKEYKEKSNYITNEDDYISLASMIWKYNEYLTDFIVQHNLFNERQYNKENIKEYTERFLFTKIHHLIYSMDNEDIYHNQRVKERILSLKFLSPDHLDIKSLTSYSDALFPKPIAEILAEPISHLNRIESCRCQYDILQCIKQTSMSIGEILRPVSNNSSNKSNQDHDLPGADEFLPMLILVITNCQLTKIYSLIKYLQRFIHSSKLVSESGYLLTHFVSAVHFLENVDAKALTISPEEYERSIKLCKQQAIDLQEKANRSNSSINNKAVSTDSSSNDIDANIEQTIENIIKDSYIYPTKDIPSLHDLYKSL